MSRSLNYNGQGWRMAFFAAGTLLVVAIVLVAFALTNETTTGVTKPLIEPTGSIDRR